jgi:hypothetical protein
MYSILLRNFKFILQDSCPGMIIEYESDDIIWFADDEYIGAEVSFPDGSAWKLSSKTREHAYYESQTDCEDFGIQSEARGVFVCSKLSGDGPPAAVIKIRLQ